MCAQFATSRVTSPGVLPWELRGREETPPRKDLGV